MTCLAPERVIEVLEEGGLAAVSPPEKGHLRECEACRDALAGSLAAGDALHAARPPRREMSGPLAAVAAVVFLGIIGWILLPSRPPSTPPQPAKQEKSLVEEFLNGSDAAGEKLLRRGVDALPELATVRRKTVGTEKGLARLAGLTWEIKKATHKDDPRALEVFEWLSQRNEGARMETGPKSVDETLAEISVQPWFKLGELMPVVLDPLLGNLAPLDPDVDTNPGPGRALEALCALYDLDYDYRYNVVFVSTPERLWTRRAVTWPAKLNGGELKGARELMERLEADAIEVREAAAASLRKLGPALIPLLEREGAIRARQLAEEIRAARRWPLQRDRNTFVDEKEPADFIKSLKEKKVTIPKGPDTAAEVAARIAKAAGIEIAVEEDCRAEPVHLAEGTLPLVDALRLSTLPLGLDVRLDGTKLTIFRPVP